MVGDRWWEMVGDGERSDLPVEERVLAHGRVGVAHHRDEEVEEDDDAQEEECEVEGGDEGGGERLVGVEFTQGVVRVAEEPP